MPAANSIATTVKNKALELGFDACGISKVKSLDKDAEIVQEWLDHGMNANMAYMSNHFKKRIDPRLLVDNSKTVISLLLNYYTDKTQSDPEAPILSKYAHGKDYHYVLKEKMSQLFSYIDQVHGPIQGRMFVDSAPVLEHAWARESGLGWIGKNSLLINKKLGSFFFIGELIIDLDMEEDPPEIQDYCGSCTACIDACPTQAITGNRTVNAGRCISYLTIENRGDIPENLASKLSNRVFGCDICQDVCPWNNKAKPHNTIEFEADTRLLNMSKHDWKNLDKKSFKALFKESPLQRAGYEGLRRNIQEIIE